MEKVELERTTCNACGSSEHVVWFSGLKDRFFQSEETYTLVRCARCSHVYLNPRPTMETLHFCYPFDYQPYVPMQSKASARLKRYVLLREVRECVKRRRPPARVLEIGCARGEFLEMLRDHGYTVAGVELDQGAAERAHARGLDVFPGTFREAGFPKSYFDIIYMKHVVEHLPDVRETLVEATRVLKPGGWLLVATPNINCPLVSYFRSNASDLDIPRHLNLYTTTSLTRQLSETGFKVVSVMHDSVPNSWVHSCRLQLENHPWARAFFRIENPIALFLFAPLSTTLALLNLSDRIRVWAISSPHQALECSNDSRSLAVS